VSTSKTSIENMLHGIKDNKQWRNEKNIMYIVCSLDIHVAAIHAELMSRGVDKVLRVNGNGPPFRRVTLTVTVRVSRVSVMVSVRDSVK